MNWAAYTDPNSGKQIAYPSNWNPFPSPSSLGTVVYFNNEQGIPAVIFSVARAPTQDPASAVQQVLATSSAQQLLGIRDANLGPAIVALYNFNQDTRFNTEQLTPTVLNLSGVAVVQNGYLLALAYFPQSFQSDPNYHAIVQGMVRSLVS